MNKDSFSQTFKNKSDLTFFGNHPFINLDCFQTEHLSIDG